MPWLAELHRLLNIQKHSELNADFSPVFFETAWRNRFLSSIAPQQVSQRERVGSREQTDVFAHRRKGWPGASR
jgi:hypothetical protein